MSKSRYVFKVVERDQARERSERFKRISKGLPVPGLESLLNTYKRKLRVRTKLVEATWSQVILLAIFYAIAINIIKTTWYESFGKPQYELSDPSQLTTEERALLGADAPENDSGKESTTGN